MNDQTYVVKQYKDTVFRLLFKEKDKLLELYNAVNNTHHTDPEELEVVTLENAVYMSMKNDVSCLLDMRIQLYEQQSTVNPNMQYVDLIRQYRKTYPLSVSVQMAVDYCIEHGILKDFLLANKAEVTRMSIFEYDEELHAKFLREEGYEDGELSHLVKQVCRNLAKNKTPDIIAEDLEEDPETINRICQMAALYAPGYDVKAIVEHLQSRENVAH